MKKLWMALLVAVLFLAACGNNVAEPESGTLTVKVNPEVQVLFDSAGLVTGVLGLNNEGISIISQFNDPIGRDVRSVVTGLVDLMHEGGFLITDDGVARPVTIELEDGSVEPVENFLAVVTSDVETTVQNIESEVAEEQARLEEEERIRQEEEERKRKEEEERARQEAEEQARREAENANNNSGANQQGNQGGGHTGGGTQGGGGNNSGSGGNQGGGGGGGSAPAPTPPQPAPAPPAQPAPAPRPPANRPNNNTSDFGNTNGTSDFGNT